MQLIFHYIDCIGCEETYTLSLLYENFWNAKLGGKNKLMYHYYLMLIESLVNGKMLKNCSLIIDIYS